MTNLELTKVIEGLQAEIQTMTVCIGRMGQKQVRNDEMIVSLKDEVSKMSSEIGALKRALNTVINQLKNDTPATNSVY